MAKKPVATEAHRVDAMRVALAGPAPLREGLMRTFEWYQKERARDGSS
jgi:hypothetical protein